MRRKRRAAEVSRIGALHSAALARQIKKRRPADRTAECMFGFPESEAPIALMNDQNFSGLTLMPGPIVLDRTTDLR